MNSKVRLAEPSRLFQNDELIRSIEQFVRTGPYLNGTFLDEFETNLADYVNTSYALGVSSGTNALQISLWALGIHMGDKVLCAANAGAYGSCAIKNVGAIARYYDVQEQGIPSLENIVKAWSGDEVAVIVTHLYGQMCDIENIRDWCLKNGLFLIEDASQAFGAKILNKSVGTYGDIGVFSFYPTKNLSTIGDAGAIVTNNAEIHEIASKIRQYGWDSKYDSLRLGGNHRMDDLHALVLNHQMRLVDSRNLKRREIWSIYENVVKQSNNSLFIGNPSSSHVAHLGVIKTPNRDDLIRFLDSRDIDSQVHYPVPDYRQAAYAEFYDTTLHITEELCNEVVSIPLHSELKSHEIDSVCEALTLACKKGIL
jgi:dTDP-3-amino-2,3,6-trideoxy-4-keto-D-glucose/dTDP-3-amino-3,4,6-trideoxy-alpha-D-glucose/dTDP-2,6-dideoxy-D-kanosamine transaminase